MVVAISKTNVLFTMAYTVLQQILFAQVGVQQPRSGRSYERSHANSSLDILYLTSLTGTHLCYSASI